MFDAPWEADVTEFMGDTAATAQRKVLGFYGGLQYALSVDTVTASATAYPPYQCSTWTYDCDPVTQTVTEELARFRLYGGPEWSWPRYTLRAGAFVDANAVGLDVGLSWHGTK